MSEKAAKKTGAGKKIVAAKAVEPRSPWSEFAAAPVNKPEAEKAEIPVPAVAKNSAPKSKVSIPKSSEKVVARPAKTPEIKVNAPKIIQTSPFKEVALDAQPKESQVIAKEFVKAEKKSVPTSPVKQKKIAPKKELKKPTLDVTAEIAAAEPKVELSPAFLALAEPKLPELKRENRARLMMQTPTQLYFYWSVRENPYRLLQKVFGDDLGSYTLVLKLTDKRTGAEVLQPAEPEGNWWFNVEPNGEYEAEIGFYAPNRPYFRIIYSNTVETPRRSPSPHAATDADWRVSANKFAEVLDVAGFSQDAFDVALAGDDAPASEQITHSAFAHFIGNDNHDLSGVAQEDIRYTLIALASGSKVEDLRLHISPSLYTILQDNAANIAAGDAMSTLTEYFDIDETEFTERQFGSAVYGASLVHFPRTLKTKRVMPRYAPLSSFSFR